MMNIRNPCIECAYYIKENNTCQSKKCATGTNGVITFWDRLFCKPYILERRTKDDRHY